MEELIQLEERLEKIQRARELNRKIRKAKVEKLQQIDILLNQAKSPKLFPIQKSQTSIEIYGMTKENIDSMISMLWGKKKKPLKQDDNQQTASTSPDKFRKFSYNERRMMSINYKLKSTQRSALISTEENRFSNYGVQRAMVYPINLPLSFFDKVRVLVFYKAMGQNIDFDEEFPTVSTKRILEFILALNNSPSNQKVDSMIPYFQQKIDEIITETT